VVSTRCQSGDGAAVGPGSDLESFLRWKEADRGADRASSGQSTRGSHQARVRKAVGSVHIHSLSPAR
jgi:hypothetical protein